MDYTGRFKDAVNFALVPLELGEIVEDATLRDRFGRELSWVYPTGPGTADPLVGRRTILRKGTVRVVAAAHDRGRRLLCLGLADDECLEPDGTRQVRVSAPCGRRRTVVFGVTRSRVEIRLAHGRPIRPRLAPIPHARGQAFLAVLGPDAEVTSVRLDGRRIITVPSRPARRQCGWEWTSR
jgi:hypothetical protein